MTDPGEESGCCLKASAFTQRTPSSSPVGEETFRHELLAQMSGRLGAELYGEERAQMAATTAERIIAEELKRRRWQEAGLRTQPRGDAENVA